MVRALGHACGKWGTSEYEARCDLRALAAHAGTALLVRAPHARRWVGKRARFEGASVPVLSIAGESTIVPLASSGRQSRGASWRGRDMALRTTASLLLVARLTAERRLSSKPPRQRFQAGCLLARVMTSRQVGKFFRDSPPADRSRHVVVAAAWHRTPR